MVAIAIFSADPILRRSLEQLLREDPAITVVGVADDPSAMLRLIDQDHVDAVLADAPPREQLADWRIQYDRTAFVVLVDEADEENSLGGTIWSCSHHMDIGSRRPALARVTMASS